MPLKINLYHEVLRARHAEQRDPLRLSMYGLIAVVACLVLYYVIALVGQSGVASDLESKKNEFKSLEPQVKAAQAEEEVLNKDLALSDNLKSRMEERFYWASLLEQVSLLTPLNLQITRCTGNLTAEPPRKCQLSIEGIAAAGENPRQVAEDFRSRLGEKLKDLYKDPKAKATFRSLEETGEKTMADGAKFNTASFTIEVAFLTKPTPEPTPPPRRKKDRLSNNPNPKDE